MVLTEDYIISKFYQYSGYPRYNRLSKSYNGGCPTCREGTSWGKKRRLYYVPRKNLVFCHNCGLSMNPVRWVQKVTDMSYGEILKENNQFQVDLTVQHTEEKIKQPIVQEEQQDLPTDSINLFDKAQLNYYKDIPAIQQALNIIQARRLDTAVNKPDSLWLSLDDKLHKNRLVIPFYDLSRKIIHYQSRTIIEQKGKKFPKYLSKLNSEKSLFGIDKIKENIPYIFVTEGPIDAFFIENGVAVAGINESRGAFFTEKQKCQLQAFPLHEIIWVLDNQAIDPASKKKTITLAKAGHKVFIWPEKFKRFKDINEMAATLKLNQISTKFILSNVYSNVKANLLLSNLT